MGRTKRSSVVLVASLGVSSCVPPHVEQAREHCVTLRAELQAETEQDWVQQAQQQGLTLRVSDVHSYGILPHGGPHVCYVVGFVPQGWERSELFETTTLVAPSEGADRATLRYGWMTWPSSEPTVEYVERVELGPARADVRVVREVHDSLGGEHRWILVTHDDQDDQEDPTQRLLVLRWREDWSYVRCEAILAGRYASLLPIFETACMAAEVRQWRFPFEP